MRLRGSAKASPLSEAKKVAQAIVKSLYRPVGTASLEQRASGNTGSQI